jgi:VWFA-related protein
MNVVHAPNRITSFVVGLLLSLTALAGAQTAPPQPPAPANSTKPAAQQPGQPAQTAPNAGEDAPPPPGSTAGRISVFSREVSLTFSVTDSKGRFITNLQQQNFGLLDDQRPPERVVHFRQLSNLPLRVGLMIDTSNSIRSRFDFEQQAAVDFLLQILRPMDRAFVEGFDVQTDISQDFTNRIDLLDTGIHKLRPGGGTSLFDSLYKTCRDQMLTLKEDQPVRRALVLVSDGDDDYSRAHESDAIKMCQRAETIVYTISTNVGPSKDKGDDVLKEIADATGGRSFFPTRMEDMATGFANIEQELRSQYSLEYVPADFKQDGSFRTIYLVSLDQRYQVHARKGYFAPRPPQ